MCVLELVPLPLGVKKSQATPTKQDLDTSKGFFSTISDEHPRRFNMGVVPGIPSSVAGF